MNKPQVGEKYRNFKRMYITIPTITKAIETLEEMVVYEQDGERSVRPMEMF